MPSPLQGLLYAHTRLGVWEPLLLAGFSPPSLQLSQAAGRQGRRGGLWLIPDTTAPFPSQAPSSETLPRWGLGGSQDPRVNPRPTRASSSAGNLRTETPLSHHSAFFLPSMWITRPCRGGLPGEPALMGTQPEGVVGHPWHLLSKQTAHSKDSLPVLAHPADPTAAQPWLQTLREGCSATPDFPGDTRSPANLPSCKAASWGGWGDEPQPQSLPRPDPAGLPVGLVLARPWHPHFRMTGSKTPSSVTRVCESESRHHRELSLQFPQSCSSRACLPHTRMHTHVCTHTHTIHMYICRSSEKEVLTSRHKLP